MPSAMAVDRYSESLLKTHNTGESNTQLLVSREKASETALLRRVVTALEQVVHLPQHRLDIAVFGGVFELTVQRVRNRNLGHTH